MINQPSGNVKLTYENLQQEAEIQGRLSVLQSEITNATKVLKGTKMECDRAVKNLAYNEELLATLTSQVEDKKKELANLKTKATETQNSLDALNSEIKTKTTDHSIKTTELITREDKIVSRETELSNQGSALGKKEVLLNNDKATFNAKVVQLKEVIKEF